MVSKDIYQRITDYANFVSERPQLFFPEEKKPAEKTKQEEKTNFFTEGLLLATQGLSFGLYDPHFTEEQKKRSFWFRFKIPIKEKILDKIPVVKQISDIFLPYDLSLATVIQYLTLGGALRIFGTLGGKFIRALRLDKPLMKISLPVAKRVEKVLEKVSPEEFGFIPQRMGKSIKLIPETTYKHQLRIYNSIATAIGVGVGEGIKSLYEASQGKKDWGEAITNFFIAPTVNSILFPLIDTGFEIGLRKIVPLSKPIITKTEEQVVKDIKPSNKSSSATENLLLKTDELTIENLAEKFSKAFETKDFSEALRSIASRELLSKLDKAGITKITFSHFENPDQIVNEGLKVLVEAVLSDKNYINFITNPTIKQVVENFVNHFNLIKRQEIAKRGLTLNKLFTELRAEPEIKKLLPEDLKDKPFTKMTLEEKERVVNILGQYSDYLGFVVKKPEILEKLNDFEGILRKIKENGKRLVIQRLVEEYFALNPQQRLNFWKEIKGDLVGISFDFSNKPLSLIYQIKGGRPEHLIEEDRKRFLEMITKGTIFPEYINQLAKQTKIIFDTNDKGETIVNLLSNIEKEGAKKHLAVLEEGLRNAPFSQLAGFERKKKLMWEDPLTDYLNKITSGKIKLHEDVSRKEIIEQTQKRIIERKADPAKWIIEERASVLGEDYDIWVFASDAYKIAGKNVNEVISAFEQQFVKGSFDEKVFERAFGVFRNYPFAKEIEKQSKTPTEKMVKLLEYFKNEKDWLEFGDIAKMTFTQEKTPLETLNKIETIKDNIKTQIDIKAKEVFFSEKAFEKIPPQILDIYKNSANIQDFSSELWLMSDKIYDFFVTGGKYGLKTLPKEGDKIVLLRPEANPNPVEVYVNKIAKDTFGDIEFYLKPTKEKSFPEMRLKPEEIAFYSLLAESGGANTTGEALYKVISKYSLKNPQIANSKGIKTEKISLKEAMAMVGYIPEPVDEILKGKRKMKIPDDTWEDWKIVFGDDLKRFGTKNPKFEPADSLATEYGFESEEDFKNYLATRLQTIRRMREEAKKIRDHYEFDEQKKYSVFPEETINPEELF